MRQVKNSLLCSTRTYLRDDGSFAERETEAVIKLSTAGWF